MTQSKRRIGILTGGGDCPGLNAAIRAVVRSGLNKGIEVFGIERGFLGFENNQMRLLTKQDVSNVISQGGTFLKSSRFNPFQHDGAVENLKKRLQDYQIEGLVVIGGDGSLGIAKDLMNEGCKVIGLPKTIDNDVFGTEFTIGFHTAVQTAVENIDRLITTAESHNLIMIVEVMGRNCGYIAAHAGLAAGAEYILVPEIKSQFHTLVDQIQKRHSSGRTSSIIVVAEDAKIFDESGEILASSKSYEDEYGKVKLGGIGWKLKGLLEERLDYESRCVVLGHVQRGGTPIAFDRYMATIMGHEAILQIEKQNWGKLIAYDQGHVEVKPLAIVRDGKKKIPQELFDVAQTYFG